VFNWGDKLGWRGSRVSAGGGALLELGFHMADLLVWTLGLPEEVYGVAACRRPRESIDLSKPAYDTDDTAAATLRYGDDSVVSLVTSRVSGPYSEGLVLCGRGGSLAADAETCVFRDPAGEIKDRFQESCPPGDMFLRQVRGFITSVHSESSRYPCPAAESLLAHAVIDSIYLAGRTCQPENPWKQLHLHGVRADECLAHSIKGEVPPVK
jgi:predicted dehydrogenase